MDSTMSEPIAVARIVEPRMYQTENIGQLRLRTIVLDGREIQGQKYQTFW